MIADRSKKRNNTYDKVSSTTSIQTRKVAAAHNHTARHRLFFLGHEKSCRLHHNHRMRDPAPSSGRKTAPSLKRTTTNFRNHNQASDKTTHEKPLQLLLLLLLL